jgi:hypothetical protein
MAPKNLSKISSKKAPKKARNPKKSQNKPFKPLNRAQFSQLQHQWYKKLKEETDFEDIEFIAPGYRDPAPTLARAHARYRPNVLHYYRQWSCFLAHNARNIACPKERDIARLYAEGVSFRAIIAELRPKYKTNLRGLNLTGIHLIIKALAARVIAWNKTSHLGLDFEADIGMTT